MLEAAVVEQTITPEPVAPPEPPPPPEPVVENLETPEVIPPLRQQDEIQIVGGTILLRRVNAEYAQIQTETAGMTSHQKSEYFKANPQKMVIRNMAQVYGIQSGDYSGREKGYEPISLSVNDALKVNRNGQEWAIMGVVSASEDGLVLQLSSLDKTTFETIPMSRADFLQLYILRDKDTVLDIFRGTPQEEIIRMYLETHDAISKGKEYKSSKEPQEVDRIIREAAKSERIHTVDDWREGIQNYYKAQRGEQEKSPEIDAQEEELLDLLRGQNIVEGAVAEAILQKWGMLSPEKVRITISGLRTRATRLEELIAKRDGEMYEEDNGEAKQIFGDRRQKWIKEKDYIDATIEIHQEVLQLMEDGAIPSFFRQLETGQIPKEEASIVIEAIRTGDAKEIEIRIANLEKMAIDKINNIEEKRRAEEEQKRRSALRKRMMFITVGTPLGIAILIALAARNRQPQGGR